MRAFGRIGAALGVLLFGNRRRRMITAALFIPALIIGCVVSHGSTDKQTARVEQQWYKRDLREAAHYAHMKPLPTGPVCTTTTKTVTTTKQGGTSQTSSSTRKGHHTTSVTHRAPTTSTQTTHERQCK